MNSVTAKQISDVMSVTPQAIRDRARAENWEYTEQSGRGGQVRHYTFSQLPADVQLAVAHLTPSGAAGQARALSSKNEEDIKYAITQKTIAANHSKAHVEIDNEKSAVRVKLTIINAAKRYIADNKLAKIKGLKQFCERYKERDLDLPAQVYEVQKSVSLNSLRRWIEKLEHGGVGSLTNNYGNRKGTGVIDSNPELLSFVKAMLEKIPHINAEQLHLAIKATYGNTFPVPAAATCRDWLATWKTDNKSLWLSLSDPDAWKNKFMVSFGRMDQAITRINQLWEFDSTPADVMLTDGRFSIVGVLDVFTRRAKCILKPTSNSAAVALLIRETVLDWGLCETARTDNGADYVSPHITSVLADLRIEHDVTDPYSGDQKPFIERFFRTFSHSIAELCQGYIGHNVAERQRIRARLTFEQRLLERKNKGEEKVALNVEISSEQFQALINNWVENTYHHNKHSSLGCTPFEQLTTHRHEIRRLDSPRLLDLLLAPVPKNRGQRTVTKSNGISNDGIDYIAVELAPYVGEKVACRYDPNNVGRLYVFHLITKEFICEAINPELVDQGITRQDIAIQARQVQKAAMKEARKQFRKGTRKHKHNVADIAFKILEMNEKANGNLSAMPLPSQQHQSDEITAVQNALDAQAKAAEPEQRTPEQIVSLERVRKELEEEEAIKAEFEAAAMAPVFNNEAHKARWLTEQSRKRTLDPMEKAWLHKFRNQNRRSAQMLDALLEEDDDAKENTTN